MSYGYQGRVIRCDLSSRTWQVMEIPEDEVRSYLLGSGLAAKILYERLDPVPIRDPLAPESPLLFLAGLLTGTFVPGACKASVVGRSPLTGIWNEATVGGFWGAELKSTGFDGLIVAGRAPEPVYLYLRPQGLEIRPASHIWQLDCFQAADALRQETDRAARIGAIGPAGVNQSRMASIIFDDRHSRAAGRGGMGALMASKNLKAVAVRGDQGPAIAHPDLLRRSIREHLESIKLTAKNLSAYGTAGSVPLVESRGDLPIKNWLSGSWEEGAKKTNGQVIAARMLKAHRTCFACPIRCGKEIELREGEYAGLDGHGPEYETTAGFGALCLNDHLESILAANELCNRYGLDTISTSSAIAFAIEAKERGILPRFSAQDPDLRWGNHRAIVATIHLIAHRKGLGDLLADGVRAAAERIGGSAHQFAIHTKGLEIAYHDPRAFTCMAVNYATANRGGCHLEALSYFLGYGLPLPDLGYEKPLDPHTMEGKAKLCVDLQNYMALYNPLGMCKFIFRAGVGPRLLAEWVNFVLDWNLSMEDLMAIGERLFNLKRLFNVRLGIRRQDDTLPSRLLTHDRGTGGAAGSLPNLERMLQEYYELRGWDEQGIPKRERLDALGLASLDVRCQTR